MRWQSNIAGNAYELVDCCSNVDSRLESSVSESQDIRCTAICVCYWIKSYHSYCCHQSSASVYFLPVLLHQFKPWSRTSILKLILLTLILLTVIECMFVTNLHGTKYVERTFYAVVAWKNVCFFILVKSNEICKTGVKLLIITKMWQWHA